MASVPLHPALVHIPLGLAFVIPGLALGFAWALWTDRIRTRGWIVIVALQALLLGAGLVAMNTGEREEDRVEPLVSRAALHTHEEYAEQFVWATGFTLALAGLVLVFRRRAAMRTLTIASVAGSLLVAGAAVRVGHAGGRLVYVDNAGAAYAAAAGSVSAAGERAAMPEKSRAIDDDDDR